MKRLKKYIIIVFITSLFISFFYSSIINKCLKAQNFFPYFPIKPFAYFRPIPYLFNRRTSNFIYPSIPDECIIQFKPGIPLNEIMRIYNKYCLIPIYISPYAGFVRVKICNATNTMSIIRSLFNEPAILFAEPNHIAKIHLLPNDPLFQYQWGMTDINTPLAWNITNGSGVIIAVIDTGVAFENNGIYSQATDLLGTLFIPGYDFVNADAYPDDDQGHGTHITGTIAQTTNNLFGCTGVAFGSTIMPIKALDASGNGALTDIVDAIYFAANNGAKIINLSFGFGNSPSITLETALDYAVSCGALPICSGGNYGNSLPNYPASYPSSVSVTSTLLDRSFASYSSYGLTVDLCAPGGDLLQDLNFDGYGDGILQQTHDGVNFSAFDFYLGKGTSWSCAFVSGTAALICSASPIPLTPLQIRNILESTAIDLGAAGWDQYFGWGLVNSSAAVAAALQSASILSTGGLVPFIPLL